MFQKIKSIFKINFVILILLLNLIFTTSGDINKKDNCKTVYPISKSYFLIPYQVPEAVCLMYKDPSISFIILAIYADGELVPPRLYNRNRAIFLNSFPVFKKEVINDDNRIYDIYLKTGLDKEGDISIFGSLNNHPEYQFSLLMEDVNWGTYSFPEECKELRIDFQILFPEDDQVYIVSRAAFLSEVNTVYINFEKFSE